MIYPNSQSASVLTDTPTYIVLSNQLESLCLSSQGFTFKSGDWQI